MIMTYVVIGRKVITQVSVATWQRKSIGFNQLSWPSVVALNTPERPHSASSWAMLFPRIFPVLAGTTEISGDARTSFHLASQCSHLCFTESQNHRITECSGLEGTSVGHL